MIICIGNILTPEQLQRARQTLAEAQFEDGQRTAGWNARQVKHNQQASGTEAAIETLGAELQAALRQHPVFRSAVQPKVMRPLTFSRYKKGMSYGTHVDNALMGGEPWVRSDVSFTLFLSDPEDYDGGELVIEGAHGEQSWKLGPGQAVCYPSTSLHRVSEVTRGERLVAVGWAQSLVRDAARRELLFDLDQARVSLHRKHGKTEEFDQLAKSYANLLRMWAEP